MVMRQSRSRVGVMHARHGARGRKHAAGDSSKDGAGLESWVAEAVSGRDDSGLGLTSGGLRSTGGNLGHDAGWDGLAGDDGLSDGRRGGRSSLSGRLGDGGRVDGRRLVPAGVGSGGDGDVALGALDDGAAVHGIHDDA